MNSGVCVKGNQWEETESDYYGIFEEVIKMTYIGDNNVILFKCQQFNNNNDMKIDPWHGLIETNMDQKHMSTSHLCQLNKLLKYITLLFHQGREREERLVDCISS